MRLRLAAVLLLLSGGAVLWLTTKRAPKSEPPSASGGAIPVSQIVRASAAPTSIAPEGNPEVPEETAAASSEPPGPVGALARPISLTATEEPPSGPEPEPTTEGASPTLPPATALENVRTAFRQYCLRLGGNPVGSNLEITAALGGQNPQQVVFITQDDGTRVNGRGELVDNWNTPYFFHQLSRTEMEIRSAGPDRRMWTSDDLVLK